MTRDEAIRAMRPFSPGDSVVDKRTGKTGAVVLVPLGGIDPEKFVSVIWSDGTETVIAKSRLQGGEVRS